MCAKKISVQLGETRWHFPIIAISSPFLFVSSPFVFRAPLPNEKLFIFIPQIYLQVITNHSERKHPIHNGHVYPFIFPMCVVFSWCSPNVTFVQCERISASFAFESRKILVCAASRPISCGLNRPLLAAMKKSELKSAGQIPWFSLQKSKWTTIHHPNPNFPLLNGLV